MRSTGRTSRCFTAVTVGASAAAVVLSPAGAGAAAAAARTKDYQVYEQELEVTSRINQALGDEAFREIALGQNYFRQRWPPKAERPGTRLTEVSSAQVKNRGPGLSAGGDATPLRDYLPGCPSHRQGMMA